MIVIAGSVRIKPDARERAAQAAGAMAEATRAEPGCRAYRFSSDLNDPTLVYIYEEWDSPESLEPHFETAHMSEFRTVLPGLVAGPVSITRYDVSSATRMS